MIDLRKKTCSKCKKVKGLLGGFASNKGTRDGKYAQCKDCIKQYRKANKEKIAEYKKQYREANKKKIAEYKKQYREANKEKIAEYAKQWYIDSKGELFGYSKQWYIDNKEKIAEYKKQYREANRDIYRVNSTRRRARLANAPGDYNRHELKDLYIKQEGRCYYCNCGLEDGYHADHFIPLFRKGTNYIENIRISCSTCNNEKYTKLPHVFLKQLGRLEEVENRGWSMYE